MILKQNKMKTNFTKKDIKQMKRILIVLLAITVSFAGYSQKKPKINKANRAREKGELAEAKEIIDAAIEHEKTKDDGKTWYYRGLIYATIDTTSNEQYNNLSDNALQEAMEAFRKADELNDKDSEYYITNDIGLPVAKPQQLNNYYSFYYNQAIEAFQNSQFEEAVANFEKSYTIFPEDTNSYVNAAYAAHNGELYDKAKENYRKAIDAGAVNKDLYNNYANILLTVDKDQDKALEVINEALEEFPEDGALAKARINILIEQGKIDEARQSLESAIEDEPDNANLYFTLGVLNDELDKRERAIEAYKKAIEIDPDHYESNYNYGVVLINQANDAIKERNNLGLSKADQKKARDMEPLITKKLEAALPQWEKIYELKPEDQTAQETLIYLYEQLDMKDKAKKIKASR